MRRRPRPLVAGGTYHVYARGARRGVIFADDDQRIAYLDDLADVVQTFGWNVMTYCLMTNHVHLLIETPHPNLSWGMQRLHQAHARRFNSDAKLRGHVFEDRFNASLAIDDRRVRGWARYIALNPVAANMCTHPAEYPWSAHAAIVGQAPRPEWLAAQRLLSLFGRDPIEALTRYRAEFVYLGGREAA